MDGYTILFSAGQVVYGLAELAIVVASIMLVMKHKSIATLLMLLGSIFSIIFYVLNQVIYLLDFLNNMDTLIMLQGGLSLAGSISFLIFTIGLIMLALQTNFSQKKSNTVQ